MSENINLIMTLPSDVCFPCSNAPLPTESYSDKIEPGWRKLDLINIVIQGPFSPSINRARYFVSFLNDDISHLDVTFLKWKSDLLQAYLNFLSRYERGDIENHGLYNDREGEYDSTL